MKHHSTWGEGVARFAEVAILVGCIVGLPLAGLRLAGKEVRAYLAFPPVMGKIRPADFSWAVFALVALGGLLVIAPLVIRFLRCHPPAKQKDTGFHRFPWWGWLGMALGGVAWCLAWTRFAWFAPLQRHTFTPLWLAYIIVVNALTQRRSGRCMLINRPLFLLTLFPLSAGFWWGFEFLNRFVENWHYRGHGADGAVEYILLGSLAFSTVLPAVLSTRDLLDTVPRLNHAFKDFIPVPVIRSKPLAVGILALGICSLIVIGLIPNWTFPFLWISPLLIGLALRTLRTGDHPFSALACGDWRKVVGLALAALICGFFWEMWNVFSLAKWTYSVPFVQRFHMFEMPLLGYLGYLPFGLECGMIVELILPESPSRTTEGDTGHVWRRIPLACLALLGAGFADLAQSLS